MNQGTRIQRSFQDLPGGLSDADDEGPSWFHSQRSGDFGWDRLLESKRILIVSEAGVGKTHECKAQCEALWEAGEPAFLFELADIISKDLTVLMLPDREKRFKGWMASQSEIATIFLDSIDELRLTKRTFESALRHLRQALDGQLGRVRIVVTTRPIAIDRTLIEKNLPLPPQLKAKPGDGEFADLMIGERRRPLRNAIEKSEPPLIRHVELMPLSDEQIKEIATGEGVDDAHAFLEELHRQNAQEFARRPQDLIELCADWREHRRIRAHRDQVAQNILVKLKPRESVERHEPAQLSDNQAIDGARQLALAVLMTRKLAIRHGVIGEKEEQGTALNPAAILTGWTAEEREALLQRPLFGFSSYNRVRFHHRSVIEYLGAQQLNELLKQGMAIGKVKRILFADTSTGLRVVKPSMRPVAAWLALTHDGIFQEICSREPEVLLNHGDPQSLGIQQRITALKAYVRRFGPGGWRGQEVGHLQIHRFASNDLSAVVMELWETRIENLEVRRLLLEIMAAVPMERAREVVHAVLMDGDAELGERIEAMIALNALNDARIAAAIASIASGEMEWPDQLLRALIRVVFPRGMSPEQLCQIIARIAEPKRGFSDLGWTLKRVISEGVIATDYLSALRHGLTELIVESARFSQKIYQPVTDQTHLVTPLAVTCLLLWQRGETSIDLIKSTVIALRLSQNDYISHDEVFNQLRAVLGDVSGALHEMIFWTDVAFMHRLRPGEKAFMRLHNITSHGALGIDAESDRDWILAALGDSTRPIDQRELMLEAAMRALYDSGTDWVSHLVSLKERTGDCATLTERLDQMIKANEEGGEARRMAADQEKRDKQARRRHSKNKGSWEAFWRKVASSPQTAFSPDQAGNTAWNLWQAMGRSGDESRVSGWNRPFIERQFSKDVADRLRSFMMKAWRDDRPTLPSERPNDKRNEFLIRWQFGLAGIAAEAEAGDGVWARKLTAEEAELACRYVLLELNGFPSWFGGFADVHPTAIDNVLGVELSFELSEPAGPGYYSAILQNLGSAAPHVVKIFLPRLLAWLEAEGRIVKESDHPERVDYRLTRVVKMLLALGDDVVRQRIGEIAFEQLAHGLDLDSPLSRVWFPVAMRMDPVKGTEALEAALAGISPEPDGRGMKWIGTLFGDRHGEAMVNVKGPGFTPALLVRLLRLAYQHVRLSDDVQHEGVYSPGARDRAEDGRGTLLTALIDQKGADSWQEKLKLADDPLFAHFRDRMRYLAQESAAGEIDTSVFDEDAVVSLIREREAPPQTRDDMFAVMMDRVDDLEDLLTRDESPRATWQKITDEHEMRRMISYQLKISAASAYTIDQEGVTADEKETDIQMRAQSGQGAVIELKLGEKWSGRQLRDAIKDQLVIKYLAPEKRRAGCLLVTLGSDHRWDHPETGARLDVDGLREMLNERAAFVEKDLGGSVRLGVRVLDLRSRFTPGVAKSPS